MTKLIITENLISDINQIKSEINIDESIVSISQEEFTANNTAALFQSDNFQFVSDSFVTYSCLLYTSPSPRDRTRCRMPSSA